MRINQINCMPIKHQIGNKHRTIRTFKNYASDSVTFRAKNSVEVPTTPLTTIDWALNWDKDARKKELDAQYDKAVKQMSFGKELLLMLPKN